MEESSPVLIEEIIHKGHFCFYCLEILLASSAFGFNRRQTKWGLQQRLSLPLSISLFPPSSTCVTTQPLWSNGNTVCIFATSREILTVTHVVSHFPTLQASI